MNDTEEPRKIVKPENIPGKQLHAVGKIYDEEKKFAEKMGVLLEM